MTVTTQREECSAATGGRPLTAMELGVREGSWRSRRARAPRAHAPDRRLGTTGRGNRGGEAAVGAAWAPKRPVLEPDKPGHSEWTYLLIGLVLVGRKRAG
jgi:hypothetical protein